MNEDYEDYADSLEDEQDQGQDLLDAQIDSYGTIPSPKEKSDQYNWFWKVVRLMRPFRLIRVGFLNKAEIGEHKVPIREGMFLGELGDTFHHHAFGQFWRKSAMITTASSMSRDGKFMELTQTQRKIRGREKKQWTPEKWRLFGKKKTTTTEE